MLAMTFYRRCRPLGKLGRVISINLDGTRSLLPPSKLTKNPQESNDTSPVFRDCAVHRDTSQAGPPDPVAAATGGGSSSELRTGAS